MFQLKVENDKSHPYLRKFSHIIYEENLSEAQERIRQSIDSEIRIKFHAYERDFDMELYASPDASNFNNRNIELSNGARYSTDDAVIFYKGKLVNEAGSEIRGTILDGAFIGTIKTASQGVFHVESSRRYAQNVDQNSDAIIYNEDDVIAHDEVHMDKRDVSKKSNSGDRTSNHVGCGLSRRSIREVLMDQQKKITAHVQNQQRNVDHQNESKSFKYTKAAQHDHTRHQSREKREATTSNGFPGGRSECGLYLKVDKILYNTIFNSEGKQSDKLTRAYLTYYLNDQVSSLNTVFRSVAQYATPTPYFNNIVFRIYKTKVI